MKRIVLVLLVSIAGFLYVISMKAQTVDYHSILKSVVAPVFPDKVFNIMDYGAINDGTTDATFNIRYKNKWTTTTLPAGAVGTYIW